MNPAYDLLAPQGTAIPLVLDSPHSGTDYPADFGYACPYETLRTAEDTHVDALFGHGPAIGASLLAARFPRSYVDVNRAIVDIDPDMLDAPWVGPISPGEKTRMGVGLIRRMATAEIPIYARRLSVDEVEARITRCYAPYHAALQELVDGARVKFGHAYHINCHSMSARGNGKTTPDGTAERPDFAMGDRDGTSCDPAFTRFVTDWLSARGYDARINDPYKGSELVRRHGRPADGLHSLQIEINRRLYMDESTREPNAHFWNLKSDLDGLLEAVRDWIAGR
jgi:N-formylglutamate deformylase